MGQVEQGMKQSLQSFVRFWQWRKNPRKEEGNERHGKARSEGENREGAGRKQAILKGRYDFLKHGENFLLGRLSSRKEMGGRAVGTKNRIA